MKKIFFCLMCFLLCACSSKKQPETAQQAAKDFCECVKKNNGDAGNLKVSNICMHELIKKYAFVRFSKSYIEYNNRFDSIPDEKLHRVEKLMFDLQIEIEKQCCEIA